MLGQNSSIFPEKNKEQLIIVEKMITLQEKKNSSK